MKTDNHEINNQIHHPLIATLPIGIIDSGVGGLSIAKFIQQQLPNEHLIYIADTLHAPYGEQSVEMIQQRVNALTQYLVNHPIKALVIACNTATVNAIDQLRQHVNIPIIGVEPAIKPAAKISKNKNIGILVTQATSKNIRFKTLVEQYKNDNTVHIQPCAGLVEMIEQGQLTSEACKQLLWQYLTPLLENNIDTLVLGCTHYPFLRNQITTFIGNKINIIETAAPVTTQLSKILEKNAITALKNQQACYQFYSSNHSTQQQQLISQLWQQPIKLNSLPL